MYTFIRENKESKYYWSIIATFMAASAVDIDGMDVIGTNPNSDPDTVADGEADAVTFTAVFVNVLGSVLGR